nr:hypothetical protein [Aestuariicella hydrocarbonica]
MFSPWVSADNFSIHYVATVDPASGLAHVEIKLQGQKLPSKLTLMTDPDRHTSFASEQPLEITGNKAVWRPQEPASSLKYEFVIDEKKGKKRYDSKVTDDWAILRSDKLIPPIAATMPRSLSSDAELHLQLPKGWSSAAPYDSEIKNEYLLVDPGRRFKRPKGWLMLGKMTSRKDDIADTTVRIASPKGLNTRLQDALAFIGWTLPDLKKIFPDFPPQLLIVTADDPMWRGGLSGWRSLFMHSDRPLISGNRTSSLIHELVHVGTGIRGDEHSDWIVEGIAEFYAVEILHRTGGISETRFQETMAELAEWGTQSEELLTASSSGATTARAAVIMHEVDQEIRKASGGKASIDDVATALAKQRGTVTVKEFVSLAEKTAGRSLQSLQSVKDQLAEEKPLAKEQREAKPPAQEGTKKAVKREAKDKD